MCVICRRGEGEGSGEGRGGEGERGGEGKGRGGEGKGGARGVKSSLIGKLAVNKPSDINNKSKSWQLQE